MVIQSSLFCAAGAVKGLIKVSKIIRVVIANSDHLFVDKLAASLQSQLNIQVVGTAFDGPGAIEICRDKRGMLPFPRVGDKRGTAPIQT